MRHIVNRMKQKSVLICTTCVQLGRSALHCAAAGGHFQVVDTLLTAGAALELTDKVSLTVTTLCIWLYRQAHSL